MGRSEQRKHDLKRAAGSNRSNLDGYFKRKCGDDNSDALKTASDQADGRHVANQNIEGTVVTPNTDEPEPPPVSIAHHTHPANEVEESGELITGIGSLCPASENYDNITHENVQTFLKNIRNLTREQKYHLLKHHARMPHDYVFRAADNRQ